MLPFVPTWALEQANEDRLTQHISKTYGKSIIFSHDFAKAFWGEKNGSRCIINKAIHQCKGWHENERPDCFRWQYHLQQMVLEEEPLKYLKKYL